LAHAPTARAGALAVPDEPAAEHRDEPAVAAQGAPPRPALAPCRQRPQPPLAFAPAASRAGTPRDAKAVPRARGRGRRQFGPCSAPPEHGGCVQRGLTAICRGPAGVVGLPLPALAARRVCPGAAGAVTHGGGRGSIAPSQPLGGSAYVHERGSELEHLRSELLGVRRASRRRLTWWQPGRGELIHWGAWAACVSCVFLGAQKGAPLMHLGGRPTVGARRLVYNLKFSYILWRPQLAMVHTRPCACPERCSGSQAAACAACWRAPCSALCHARALAWSTGEGTGMA